MKMTIKKTVEETVEFRTNADVVAALAVQVRLMIKAGTPLIMMKQVQTFLPGQIVVALRDTDGDGDNLCAGFNRGQREEWFVHTETHARIATDEDLAAAPIET